MLDLYQLEITLFLFLYMESPGPLNSDSSLRTVSDCFVLHKGFALGLFLCLYIELTNVILTSPWVYMTSFVSYVILVAVMGCIVYGPEMSPNHLIFASIFFFFAVVLTTVRYLQNKANMFQIVTMYISFLAVIAVAYFQAYVLGIVEIIFLYFMLNSWVYVDPHSNNLQHLLMAKLYDNNYSMIV